MPTIKYLSIPSGLSFSQSFFGPAFNGTFSNATAASVTLATSDGFSVVFKGSFSVSGGAVTGGIVSGFDSSVGETQTARADGYAISFADLSAAITAAQMFSSSALYALILNGVKHVGSASGDGIFGSGTMLGRGGDDFISGGLGADKIKGGDGDDVITGNGGGDKLWGGEGHDAFAFYQVPTIPTLIKDFAPGEDVIVFDGFLAVPFGPGLLSTTEFGIGKAAEGAEKLFYDKKSGGLFFDADGTGTGAAVQIADLDAHLHLKAKNFAVGDLD